MVTVPTIPNYPWIEVAASVRGGQDSTRDAVTTQYFNGHYAVRRDPKVYQAELPIFGRHLDPAMYGALVGAIDEATVSVVVDPTLPRIIVEVKHERFITSMVRSISRDQNGQLALYNHSLFLNKAVTPDGLGTRILAYEVAAAARLGIPLIRTHAARGVGVVGYWVWARLGFLGALKLAPAVRAQMPTGLASATNVAELMNSQEGRDFWLRYGHALPDARFEVRESSCSWQTLQNYLQKTNVAIGDQLLSELHSAAPVPAVSAPSRIPAVTMAEHAPRRSRSDPGERVRQRFSVLTDLVGSMITMAEAEKELALTPRQIRRLRQRFEAGNCQPESLAYGRRHPAHNRMPPAVHDQIRVLYDQHPDWSERAIAAAVRISDSGLSRLSNSTVSRFLRAQGLPRREA